MRESSLTMADMDNSSIGDLLNLCEHTGQSAIVYVDNANGDLAYIVLACKLEDWKTCLESLLERSKHF